MTPTNRHRHTLHTLQMARESRDGFPSRYESELRTLVFELCDALAVERSIRDEALKVAGLRELGMLGVSHPTLTADRTLTEEEVSEVRRAPLVAQSLVASMPGYESAAEAARFANERWDGHGYPDGIKGEQIPVASRIVAVASAFQAMSTPRPFRPAMSPKLICQEIEGGRGTQFDPTIVDAFLTMIRPVLGE